MPRSVATSKRAQQFLSISRLLEKPELAFLEGHIKTRLSRRSIRDQNKIRRNGAGRGVGVAGCLHHRGRAAPQLTLPSTVEMTCWSLTPVPDLLTNLKEYI